MFGIFEELIVLLILVVFGVMIVDSCKVFLLEFKNVGENIYYILG